MAVLLPLLAAAIQPVQLVSQLLLSSHNSKSRVCYQLICS
jgi:hypothetical protein